MTERLQNDLVKERKKGGESKRQAVNPRCSWITFLCVCLLAKIYRQSRTDAVGTVSHGHAQVSDGSNSPHAFPNIPSNLLP